MATEFWYVHSVEELVIWTVEREKGLAHLLLQLVPRGREEGRERGREGGREGGREREGEGGREGGNETDRQIVHLKTLKTRLK